MKNNNLKKTKQTNKKQTNKTKQNKNNIILLYLKTTFIIKCLQHSSVLPLLMLSFEVLLKSFLTFLNRYLYHILVKFEQNLLVQTTRNVLAFWQKRGFKTILRKR